MLHRPARREGAGAQVGDQIDQQALGEMHIPRHDDQLFERWSSRGERRRLNEDWPANRAAPLLELDRITRPALMPCHGHVADQGSAGGTGGWQRDRDALS